MMQAVAWGIKSLIFLADASRLNKHIDPNSSPVADIALEALSKNLADLENNPRSDPTKIKIIPTLSSLYTHALGNTYFRNSPKVVLINPKLIGLDEDAAVYWCRHQMVHLKRNDSLYYYGTLLVITVAAGFFCPTIPSFLFIVTSSRFIAIYISDVFFEKSVHDAALAEASLEEIKGVARYITALDEAQKELSPWKILQPNLSAMRLNDIHFHESEQCDYQKTLIRRFGYTLKNLQNLQNEIDEDGKTQELKLFFMVHGSL